MNRRIWLSRATRTACAVALPAWLRTAQAEPGISANQIVIGNTAPRSGILAGFGDEMVAGIQAAFKNVNANGGVAGRQLRLASQDDGYVPARTADIVQKMLAEDDTFALLSCLGTGNVGAILPMTEKAGMPLVGPVTGASSLRQPGQRNTFFVRASYRDETTRLLQKMMSWGMTDLAVVYLDNPFGKEVLRDAEATVTGGGGKAPASFALAGDGSNADALARQVQAARPGSIYLGTTGTASTAFVKAFRALSPSTPIAGLSVSVIPTEMPKLSGLLAGVALAQVFPDAASPRLAMARAFQQQMREAGDEARISGSSLEGWLNAQVLVDGLRRCGGDLKRERLRTALAGMRKFEVHDFQLGFSAQAPYVASNFIDLAVLNATGKRVG